VKNRSAPQAAIGVTIATIMLRVAGIVATATGA
jgi:hypothetical protein